ncbi:MAG TPA: J domain-containing protein [Longimicrobiales bacterium]|nr:J domain-containing protein [Longimicrobiales bacterium]
MDLYTVLGVRGNASMAEIRRAYQKAARQLHPDLNPGDPVASRRFQAVSAAFEVLADAQRRAAYDRGEVPRPAIVVPEVGFEGFDFSAEVRVGSAGFQDIFEGVLRGPRDAARDAPHRGEDLEQPVRITFDECFHPSCRRVHVVRLGACGACGGAGAVAVGPRPCPDCGGTGQVRSSRGRMIFTRRCPECGGTGALRARTCGRCAGEGRLMQSDWMDVELPAGVEEGSRVRITGAGNAGRRGGEPGDFVLVVQVESHPFYRREGEDLHCQVPVTMVEAALGGHVEVPTPEGPVVIEIPAGTQTGQRFRLRKRGLPRLGEDGRGDLYVEARVFVPRVRDDESRELLREFARRNPDNPRRETPLAPAAGQKGS